MKRLYCLTLCLILSICFHSTALASDSNTSSTTIEFLNDGSYIETILTEDCPVGLFSTTSTKSGRKTSTYKNSSGQIQWSVTVNGTFSYNGSSAKCTVSSISTACPSKYWTLSGKSASKSGATAIASATAKHTNGSNTKTIQRSVRLTCNKDGTLS